MRKYCKKPIFWAAVAAAVCVCVALTGLVVRLLSGGEQFRSAQALHYAGAVSRALRTDGHQPETDIFASCSLDGGYTVAAFTANGTARRSGLGAALFGPENENKTPLDLAFCPNGAFENGGTQILRLTLPDGTAYDAVVSTDRELKSVERWENDSAQSVIQVENCPFFALFACGSADALTEYIFYGADGQELSAETNDMSWITEAAYSLERCLYARTGYENYDGDLVLFGENSLTLFSDTSDRVLDSVGGIGWNGRRLTDAQWQEMFDPAEDAQTVDLVPYARRLMLDAGRYRVFCMGSKVWFAFLDKNGKIECLYELSRQPGL